MSAVLTETQSPVLDGAPPLPAAGTLPAEPAGLTSMMAGSASW